MAVSSQLTKGTQKKNVPTTFSSFMTSPVVTAKVNKLVGGEKGERFISSIVSAVSTNPALAKCDFNSILSGALQGESIGLIPSPQFGQYYLVPYGNKAQFQIGYHGYIQLAHNTGMYKKLNVAEVKLGELVKYDPFNEEIEFEAITDPLQRENAETVGYYAMFELNYGLTKKMYWSKERMLNHAKKFSKAFNSPSSYWQKDFDAMAKKTMLRQLISKWGYMSTEMQMAFESDMAVINEDGSKNYVDNPSVADAFTPQEDAIEVPQEQIQEEEEPF